MTKTEKFIKKAQNVHKSIYEYDKTIYTNVDKKVTITCKKHGEFNQTPREHLYKKAGCNKCAVERSMKTNTKTTEQFIKEAIEIHKNKYDYSLVNYINATTPVIISCPIHKEFNQLPSTHTSKKCGCPKCANDKRKLNTEQFITRSNLLHNNSYTYTKTQYTTGREKITITCKKHGDFEQAAESHLQGIGCPTCGLEKITNVSQAELEISETIKRMGNKVVEGTRSIIPPKEIDIFIPDKNIAIEYDGIFWHSELGGKNRKYHVNKTNECKKRNVRLIHIFENEWIHKKDIVLSRICNMLGKSEKIYARKCRIVKVQTKDARQFLDNTHIQGFSSATVYYGLEHDNEIVSLMSFGKSRFNKKVEWELIRYSNRLHTSVIGGASRLFKHFIKQHQPKSVISYSDKRWNTGNLYTQLGFEFSHFSSPNYFYFHKNSTTMLLTRQKFQKHKLKNKLEHFDSNLTEWENMQANGYNRIWDCGNDVFLWGN